MGLEGRAVTLSLTVNADDVLRAVLKAPELLVRELDKAIGRSVHTMARTARKESPKHTSVLTNSINVERPNRLEGLVRVGVAYGLYVHAGVKPGSFPNVEHIHDWVRQRGLVPVVPGEDTNDIAWRVARSLARRGQPPRPFLTRAFNAHRAEAQRRVDVAIRRALDAV